MASRTNHSGLCAAQLALAVGVGLVWTSEARAQSATERSSLSAAGLQVQGDSDQVALSGDGRWVAFRSTAADLVPGDTNGVSDVFVKDRWTGATERVSVSSSGAQGTAASMEPWLSFDGRYVVFASEANNLATDVVSGSSKDIFLRDRLLGTTVTVTRSAQGGASNGDCHRPRISGDGRYVTFEGSAGNLVPGLPTSGYQVFRRDMQGSIALVSVSLAGAATSGFSWNGDLSDDGRYVCFVSSGADLVAGDTNFVSDCFWRDMLSGQTRRVSVSSSGAQGTSSTFTDSTLSRDGRFVAFSSNAPNLAPGEFGAGYDIFLHDTVTATTTRISLTSGGVAANGNSYEPSISDDGRYVAFRSFSTNLDPLDTDLQSDVFLRDRTLGTTVLLSRSAAGGSNAESFSPVLSSDGAIAAFYSTSSDLVPQDTNLRADVFVRDTGEANHAIFCAGTTVMCPCSNAGVGGAGCENSAGTGGGLLRGFGRASTSSDQLTLQATGLPAQTSALFFQGTQRENNGAGTRFGDGLRCAGGTQVRLSQYAVTAGVAALGHGAPGALGTPIHTRGLVPQAGGTRTYQVWYRNSAVYCTSDVFNLTNGVEVVWTL